MIVEVLLYQLKPNTGESFFAVMRDLSVPLHRRHGLDVVWHGQSLHHVDGYGLIRAFSDEAAMTHALDTFYASDAWRQGPREAIVSMIDVSTRIVVPMNHEAITALRKEGSFSRSAHARKP